MAVLSIDPGTGKSGFAIFDDNKNVLIKGIKSTGDLLNSLEDLIKKYNISIIVIGAGTGRIMFQKIILGVKTVFIDEKNTTMDAKKLYWQINPPKGFWRLIPTIFRIPPKPIDDLAAQILGLRYLDGII